MVVRSPRAESHGASSFASGSQGGKKIAPDTCSTRSPTAWARSPSWRAVLKVAPRQAGEPSQPRAPAPRRPQAPLSQLADDQAAPGLEDARHLANGAFGLGHEGEDGDHRDDVEAPVRERQARRVGDDVVDGRFVLRRAGDGASDHARIGVATRDRCSAGLGEGERQRAVAASHVEHGAPPQIACQAQQEPALERLDDLAQR